MLNLLASNAGSYVVLGVLVVLLVVYFVWSSKSMKKRQGEREKLVEESLRVGAEVLTIGGITGTIVELTDGGEYFVIETGTDMQKSYVKFAKVAFHSLIVHGLPEEEFSEEYASETESAEPVETEEKND